MQVCHGKPAPLRRLQQGDGIIYYSPTFTMGGIDRCQSFTAFGIVADGDVYQTDMGSGFHPYRRGVTWSASRPVSIRPLLKQLELTKGKSNWAYPFRFGLLEISTHDFDLVAQAMAEPAE